ncbi:MAG: TraB/GumN family protein [Thermodesulfobacteriota bacterium]
MSSVLFPMNDYPDDVSLIEHRDKTILLIGTAHISQHSVDLVREVIEQEQPDSVCIELDEKRYQSLVKKKLWQSLDLRQIIKNKQLSTLMVNLIMAGYQKKLGDQLGVKPGAELLAAAEAAKKNGCKLFLCDRDVRITLRRAWKSTSLYKKGTLLVTLLASMFDDTKLDEDKLKELKEKDMLSELMDEMGDALPGVKRVLIDERDVFLAEKIKEAEGNRIVAVVGAGHVKGITEQFNTDNRGRLTEITTIPPISSAWKIAGWAIPAIIIGSIIAIGIRSGTEEAGASLIYWILANGIPAAIGGMIALAHPFTTLGAFAAAPVTSLTPVIGAGYVAAFIQVMIRPPMVKEFEQAGADVATVKGWWRNKLLRVFLVFILTGFGSSIGTYIGGYEIIKNLFS